MKTSFYQTDKHFFDYKKKMEETTSSKLQIEETSVIKLQNYMQNKNSESFFAKTQKYLKENGNHNLNQTNKNDNLDMEKFDEKVNQERKKRETKRGFDLHEKMIEKKEMAERFKLKMEEERQKRLKIQLDRKLVLEELKFENERKKLKIEIEKEKTENIKKELQMALKKRVEFESKYKLEHQNLEKENRILTKKLTGENLELLKQEKKLKKKGDLLNEQMMLYLDYDVEVSLNNKEKEEREAQYQEKMDKMQFEKLKWDQERKEQKKLEIERNERLKLEKEQLYKERNIKEKEAKLILETEKKEREKIENEKLEIEKAEKELLKLKQAEKMKEERIKFQEEKLEKEKNERIKFEIEKAEKLKIEEEKNLKIAQIDKEKKELNDKIEAQKYKEEQIKNEREKLEREKKEKERLEIIELEKRENEKKQQQKIEQNKIELEANRIEQEKIRKEQSEKKLEMILAEKKRVEQIEMEKREKENKIKEELKQDSDLEEDSYNFDDTFSEVADQKQSNSNLKVQNKPPVIIESTQKINVNENKSQDFDSFSEQSLQLNLKDSNKNLSSNIPKKPVDSPFKKTDNKTDKMASKENLPSLTTVSPQKVSFKENSGVETMPNQKKGGIRGLRDLAQTKNIDNIVVVKKEELIQTQTKIENLYTEDTLKSVVINALQEDFMPAEDLHEFFNSADFSYQKILTVFNELISDGIVFFFDFEMLTELISDFSANKVL